MDFDELRDKIQGFIDQIKSKLQNGPKKEDDEGIDASGDEDQASDGETVKMVDAYGRTMISAPLEKHDDDGEDDEDDEGEKTQVQTQVTKGTTKDIQGGNEEDEAKKKRSMLIKIAAIAAIIVVGAPEVMNLLGPKEVNLEDLPPPKKRKRRKKKKKPAFFPKAAKNSKDTTSDSVPAPGRPPKVGQNKPQKEKRPFFPNAKSSKDMTADTQVTVVKSPKRPFFPKAKNATSDGAPKVASKEASVTPESAPKAAPQKISNMTDATIDSAPVAKTQIVSKMKDTTADSAPMAKPQTVSKTKDATTDSTPQKISKAAETPAKKARRGPASVSDTSQAMGIPPETPAEPLRAGEVPEVSMSDTTSDKSVARNPAQVMDDSMENEKEIEYTPPPNFERRGRGLVYNCAGKHWACVDKFSYFQCRENQVWNERNQKSHECMIRNVYASIKDCITVQTHSVSTAADTSFCDPSAEKEN